MAKAANIATNVSDSEWRTVVEPYADSWDFGSRPELVGKFLGSRLVSFTDKRSGEVRDVTAYEIQTSDGKTTVWGSYNIDAAFADIAIGNLVRIVYEGTADLEGGRSVNKFTVQTKPAS